MFAAMTRTIAVAGEAEQLGRPRRHAVMEQRSAGRDHQLPGERRGAGPDDEDELLDGSRADGGQPQDERREVDHRRRVDDREGHELEIRPSGRRLVESLETGLHGRRPGAPDGTQNPAGGDRREHDDRQPADRHLDRRDHVGERRPEQGRQRGIGQVRGGRPGAGRPAECAAAADRGLDDQDRDGAERDRDAETGGDTREEGGLQASVPVSERRRRSRRGPSRSRAGSPRSRSRAADARPGGARTAGRRPAGRGPGRRRPSHRSRG